MKKFTALLLIFSLVMLSANLYAKERRGAKLLVTKTNGQQVQGELITVKPNSLLLLDTEGKDVSVDIADIKVIRIVKKSKFWKGAGIGLLVAGVGGALLGHSGGDDPSGTLDILTFTAEQKALIVGIGFGLVGLILGGTIGAAVGTDKTIQIEGKSELEIQETLNKLRKKARIRDYK